MFILGFLETLVATYYCLITVLCVKVSENLKLFV